MICSEKSRSGTERYFCVQAYADYIGFILTLNEGVKGKKLTCDYPVSEVQPKSLITPLSHCARRTVLTCPFLLPALIIMMLFLFFLSSSLCISDSRKVDVSFGDFGSLDR